MTGGATCLAGKRRMTTPARVTGEEVGWAARVDCHRRQIEEKAERNLNSFKKITSARI